MKFKYYLRGAGIGVIVSTVILSIAFLLQNEMSDAQVIQRARELGMITKEEAPKTLADVPKSGAAQAEADSKQNGEGSAKEPQDGSNASAENDSRPTASAPPAASAPAETTKPQDSGSDDSGQKKGTQTARRKITITVVEGDESGTVAAKLFEAGLIDNAGEFNDFLGNNGYDNQLQQGTFKIEKGSSFEQIAEALILGQ